MLVYISDNMLVSELLFSHDICAVPHFRGYSPDSLRTEKISEMCRVSSFVWENRLLAKLVIIILGLRLFAICFGPW